MSGGATRERRHQNQPRHIALLEIARPERRQRVAPLLRCRPAGLKQQLIPWRRAEGRRRLRQGDEKFVSSERDEVRPPNRPEFADTGVSAPGLAVPWNELRRQARGPDPGARPSSPTRQRAGGLRSPARVRGLMPSETKRA